MAQIAYLFALLMGGVAWLVPNHYPPWASAYSEAMMAAAFVVAGVGALAEDRRSPLPWTQLQWMTAGLMTVPLLQWLAGLIPFFGDAWMTSIYLLGFWMAQTVGVRLARRYGAAVVLEKVAALLVFVSLACAGLALYQWFGLRGLGNFAADLPPKRLPFANVGQPNHLAMMLFLGVVGVLYLHDRRRVHGASVVTCCSFLTFAMVMTGSRTAWLIMAVLVIAICLAQRCASLRMSRSHAAALAALFAAFVFLWAPLCDALLLSAGRTLTQQTQVGPRLLLWQTALDAIALQPWWGYGWGQTLVAHSQVVTERPADGRLMGSAHNLALDLLIWNGVLLGGLVVAALIWWWWRRVIRCGDSTSVYLLIAISAVFAHALVEHPLTYAYFLLPLGLMVGLLDHHCGSLGRRQLSAPWSWGLTALASGALIFTMVEYSRIEDNTRVLRFELARIGTGRIESVAPDLIVLTHWREYLRFARVEARPGMSPDELAWMRRVTERFPFAQSQFRSALAHGLNGHPEIAAEELRRLCSMQTAKRCSAQLAIWRNLQAEKYPQLQAVPLPKVPESP